MTYVNTATGKGWTDEEEQAFADIVAASRLTRIEAIQLWKRCRKNTIKAVHLARLTYPKLSQAMRDKLAKARMVRLNGISIDGVAPRRRQMGSQAPTHSGTDTLEGLVEYTRL